MARRLAPTYVGKTCPYCLTAFTPEDRVVACPVCGMPHHADCWQENGHCTTYGCRGAATPSSPTFWSSVPPPMRSPSRSSWLLQPIASTTTGYLGVLAVIFAVIGLFSGGSTSVCGVACAGLAFLHARYESAPSQELWLVRAGLLLSLVGLVLLGVKVVGYW